VFCEFAFERVFSMSGYSNETFYHIGSRLMAAFSAPRGVFSETPSASSERARSEMRSRARLH
jgi:hypothetical protein